MNWLKKQFGWMFTQGNGSKSRVGTVFLYGDGEIPQWALLGEYDNGSALPAAENNLRNPGQYSDEESNLVYNHFRTYDPRIRGGYIQLSHRVARWPQWVHLCREPADEC